MPRFGEFELDLGSRELRKRGHRVPLRQQSVEILAMLMERPGELVTRDQIRERLWPDGTVVEFEHSVNSAVNRLREVLGDSPAHPRFIETLPRRGYRFVAAIPEPAREAATPPSPGVHFLAGRLSWALTVVAVAVITGALAFRVGHPGTGPAIRSVAVLPLANLSGDPEQEYFADGMTEALITRLAESGSMKVISRTSIMRYKGSRKALPEIARELGVDGIVEGTVLRSGASVRVTAQLIRADTDLHVWSHAFERDMTDVLSLQADVAQAIAGEVRLALSPPQRERLGRSRRVVPEAYTAYLRGWYLFNRSRYREAASEFEQAARADPGFALAYAMLTEADTMVTFTGDQPMSQRAVKALARARELDDSLAEVHTDLGDVKFSVEWDWRGGEAEFRRAVEIDRGSVDAVTHYALCLHQLGRWEEAIAELRRAHDLDPASPRLDLQMARALVDAHRYGEALEELGRSIELDAGNPAAYEELALAYSQIGREKDADAACLKAAAAMPVGGMNALQAAARAGGCRGYWQEMLRGFRQPRGDGVPPYTLAAVYTRLGEKDAALGQLELAFRQHAPRMIWLRARSTWDPLRGEARFQELLRAMRFPD